MKTALKYIASKSPAARSARKPETVTVNLEFGDGKPPFTTEIEKDVWQSISDSVGGDMVLLGAALAENVSRNRGLQKVEAHFTDAQLDRLKAAAALACVTVEELVISGAMGNLDWNAEFEKDGIQALGFEVEHYARERKAFKNPKYGTHPLQSLGTNAVTA